jgi:hypothetical protein
MTIVLTIGLIVEFLLIIQLEHKAHKNESGIFCIDGRVDRLTHDIMGSEESIKVLSDSVRKLNGVVKDLEQKQPKVEPKNRMNTRAFIAGWDADEPEESELLSHIEARTRMAVMDVLQCQNFAQQGIIDNLNCRNIYPWQPWQPLQTGALNAGMGVTYRQ